MLSITDYLTKETDIETQQKETGKHIPDYDSQNAGLPRLTNDLFLANRSIYISKHNRYAPYPKHTHQFLELNYVLQGQCHKLLTIHPIRFTRETSC